MVAKVNFVCLCAKYQIPIEIDEKALLFDHRTIISPIFAMMFTPPSREEIHRAIGDIKGLPMAMQRAFSPVGFDSIPVPKRGDWLAEHLEPGQTFDDFRGTALARPDKDYHKIYLQPLGDFIEGQSPSLRKLKAFATSYFMMDVEVLPLSAVEKSRITARRNPYTLKRQILTRDVLAILKRKNPPTPFASWP